MHLHAGAGGTESHEWVAILLRMYLRWAKSQGIETELLSSTESQGGLASVLVRLRGPKVVDRLDGESGLHKLGRVSPYDKRRRRHTSFALVEVYPEVKDDGEVRLDEKDVRIDVFRSSGAGGQHMQKNSTAVRLTHLPTKTVVVCQNERSQFQNRQSAWTVLRSRLKAMQSGRALGTSASSEVVRSYIQYGQEQVVDYRSGIRVAAVGKILDGDLHLLGIR